jgi:hypothetical protein
MMSAATDVRSVNAPRGGADAGPGCPYLQRTRPGSRYSIEGYCLASADGGLRVVTIAEFHELCTTPEHIRCELYRGEVERASRSERQRKEGTSSC